MASSDPDEQHPGATVVTLGGEYVIETGTPNSYLVAELEARLAQARAGEIQGMAAAYLNRLGTASHAEVGHCNAYALLGALGRAHDWLSGFIGSLEQEEHYGMGDGGSDGAA